MTRQARLGGGLLAVLVLTTAFRGGQALTKEDSAGMQRKLDAIAARGSAPAMKTSRPLRTSFTEREVNAYFKYDGKPHIPAGVVNPQVVISDNGQLEGNATVDLDEVRKAQPSAALDLLAIFAGSVEVHAVGRLQTADGKGTFTLDRATVAGFSVPKSLLQTLVTHYSRNPDLPDGFNLDKPFDLPSAIRTVELQRGAAVIVQ